MTKRDFIGKNIDIFGALHVVTRVSVAKDSIQVKLRPMFRDIEVYTLETKGPENLQKIINLGISHGDPEPCWHRLGALPPSTRKTFGQGDEDRNVILIRFDPADDEDTLFETYEGVKSILLSNQVWCIMVFKDGTTHTVRRDHIYDIKAGKSVAVQYK